jgi:hypothetical protein
MYIEKCAMCPDPATRAVGYIEGEEYPVCQKCYDEYYTIVAYKEIQPLLEKLFSHINSCRDSYSSKGFVRAFSREHRTLQQSFFRTFIIPLIQYYAGLEDGYFDLRNEAIVLLCKELLPIINKSAIPFI